MYLNLDIASQPMVQSGSLPDVVLDFLRGSSRNLTMQHISAANVPGPELIRLNRFLKGLKVQLVVADRDGLQVKRASFRRRPSSTTATAPVLAKASGTSRASTSTRRRRSTVGSSLSSTRVSSSASPMLRLASSASNSSQERMRQRALIEAQGRLKVS